MPHTSPLMETESRSVSRDLDAGSTDDGGGEEEAGRTKACTECKLVKTSTEVSASAHGALSNRQHGSP